MITVEGQNASRWMCSIAKEANVRNDDIKKSTGVGINTVWSDREVIKMAVSCATKNGDNMKRGLDLCWKNLAYRWWKTLMVGKVLKWFTLRQETSQPRNSIAIIKATSKCQDLLSMLELLLLVMVALMEDEIARSVWEQENVDSNLINAMQKRLHLNLDS